MKLPLLNSFFKGLFLVIGLFYSGGLVAQKKNYGNEQEKFAIIEQRIEWLAENLGDEEPDLNALFDKLLHYIDHPLDLNRADKSDLTELSLLTQVQIDELLNHLERTGKFISIYEIQCLPSWDMTTIEQVLPFIYIDDRFKQPHLTFKQLLQQSTNELYFRWSKVMQEQKGYLVDTATGKAKYAGTNDRVYTRYRFRSGNNISIGFTGEKDAGEKFENGFDFNSAHFFIRDIGFVKHAVVGDYLAAFGQGLTFGMGPALGKTASSLSVKRVAYKLKPYTSVDENLFLRGGATTIKLKNIEVTGFFSQKKNDANVDIDTTEGSDDDMIVSSFQTTGLHATESEIADKDAITETIAGGHISYGTRKFEIGTTFYNANYSASLQRDAQFYNQFDFNGNNNAVGGINYSALIRNVHLFGETSMSSNKGWGTLNGAILSLDPKVGMLIMYRNYQRDFQNLYTNAVAEASRPVNEKGLYAGLEVKPSSKWIINGYADAFVFPWLKFGVDAPSKGNEMMAQVTWKPNKQTEIYVRFRQRNKEENTDVTVDDIEYIVNKKQTNYRLNLVHKVNKSITLHSRIESVIFDKDEEPKQFGYMAFQDIIFKPLSSPFSFNLRYAVFNTDNYDTRIYAYEKDVLYYYSIPAYYYRGSKMYGNIRYQYKKWFDLWVKVAYTIYDNQTTVGSGNDEINGNQKTEVRVQLRFSF